MRFCEIPGCKGRKFSPRLCSDHYLQWTASAERYEGDRSKDFAGTYARWLKRFEPVVWKNKAN